MDGYPVSMTKSPESVPTRCDEFGATQCILNIEILKTNFMIMENPRLYEQLSTAAHA